MILKVTASLFLIIAVVCFLELTPQQVSDDIVKLTTKKESIRDRARAIRTGKKKKRIGDKLIYTQEALKAMGKESKFAFVVCASLVLFVAGAVIAVFIDNVFLVCAFTQSCSAACSCVRFFARRNFLRFSQNIF